MSGPMDYLKESIAASSNFQDWIGVDEELSNPEKIAAAKERIFFDIADDSERPFALLESGPRFEATRTGHGTSDAFDQTGQLNLYFDADLPAEITVAAAIALFKAQVDLIIADIMAVSGTGGYLAIAHLETEGPRTGPDDRDEEILQILYTIDWK